MAPQAGQLGRPRPAGVGQPVLERSPQRPLGRAQRGRRVAGNLLGQLLGGFVQPFRRVDDLAHQAELIGACGAHPLVPAGQRHPQHRLGRHLAHQRDRLHRAGLADRDVRVGEGCVGGGQHDVRVGDEVQPAARAHPVHSRDHRNVEAQLPRGEAEVEPLHRLPVALHAQAVGGQFDHVHAGLERGAAAGVDDHPDPRVAGQLGPGLAELGAHDAVHRVALGGAVEEQPADVAAPFDFHGFVLASVHAWASQPAASSRLSTLPISFRGKSSTSRTAAGTL